LQQNCISYTGPRQPLHSLLVDLQNERIKQMDQYGNEFQVLSLTSPGPQGLTDPKEAGTMATKCNDWMAQEVKKNPHRLGAFCSLSMHDPHAAAVELRRCVEMGLCGAILNDWQSTGDDGNGVVLYDIGYDEFWKTVQELDVPIYFHPRWPTPYQYDIMYNDRLYLVGAIAQFHTSLTMHIVALCTAGVFDRFPGAKVIIGHLGETFPMQLGRADPHARKMIKRGVLPAEQMKQSFTYYFHHNIYITTSGHFTTRALQYCMDVLPLDHILFSIDFPYETIEDAQTWWDTLEGVLTKEQLQKIGRENAIKLLKLPIAV